eukprot:365481-Chlamydomonas_euryale.AAC.4
MEATLMKLGVRGVDLGVGWKQHGSDAIKSVNKDKKRRMTTYGAVAVPINISGWFSLRKIFVCFRVCNECNFV